MHQGTISPLRKAALLQSVIINRHLLICGQSQFSRPTTQQFHCLTTPSTLFSNTQNLPCRGDFGRLGHGDIIDVFLPKPIAGLSGIGITRLACGDTHTIALSATGQVYSFGRNQNGQLGLGSDRDALGPVHVEALRVSRQHSVIGSVVRMQHVAPRNALLMTNFKATKLGKILTKSLSKGVKARHCQQW